MEEDKGPGEVEYELDGEEEHRVFTLLAAARSPDQPCRHRHGGVEDRPDWSEDPVGWIESWFDQSGVPAVDLGRGEVRPQGSYCEADDEK